MLEVRMKPPPPTPPHIAALSYFWGHWGSEDPSLKTTNPSFLTLLCLYPASLSWSCSTPKARKSSARKTETRIFSQGPRHTPAFLPHPWWPWPCRTSWDRGGRCQEEMQDSPVLSELQRMVSFSALTPGLGPCFIHMVIVN